jgi:transcriptional regulator with XRE-family HTH domain
MQTCLENIGGNIRKLRKERTMTIEDLSDQSGLSAKYLQGVETAKNNISVVNLENIAKALNVDMGELIETNSDYFKKSDEKFFHISSRLKRYGPKQLTFVYEMLDIIEELGGSEQEEKYLITPRYRNSRRKAKAVS